MKNLGTVEITRESIKEAAGKFANAIAKCETECVNITGARSKIELFNKGYKYICFFAENELTWRVMALFYKDEFLKGYFICINILNGELIKEELGADDFYRYFKNDYVETALMKADVEILEMKMKMKIGGKL